MKNASYHEPVMVREVIKALRVGGPRGQVIDATIGTGGHSLEILENGAKVLGIEIDPEILAMAGARLAKYQDRIKLTKGNFKDIDLLVSDEFRLVDGILFDLGVTNLHLKDFNRGFSFSRPEDELDMRLDRESQGVSAADLLNTLRQDHLEELFADFMDRNKAKALSKKIIDRRKVSSFKLVKDLVEVSGFLARKGKLHPATKVFLALRIAVNSEIENLTIALPKAFSLLREKGRLLVISFHSLEDRIVKGFFSEMEEKKLASILTQKPLVPEESEIFTNPRARSAKLRVLEKI